MLSCRVQGRIAAPFEHVSVNNAAFTVHYLLPYEESSQARFKEDFKERTNVCLFAPRRAWATELHATAGGQRSDNLPSSNQTDPN